MKKKRLVLTVLLITFCFTTLYLTAGTRYSNDLVRYVAKAKNKIPNRYTAPTGLQVSIFREIIRHIVKYEYSSATQKANSVDYTLKSFTHTNRTYYILESKYPKYRPWGTYIFYRGTDAIETIVEIPHPVSERNVANIGIKLFINTNTKAKAYLLSGSRRSKFDVAFRSDNNIFQAVHEELTNSYSDVIQIHGFKIYNYPRIVVTSGTSTAPLDKYVKHLLGFDVGVFDGVQYSRLGSTNNLQAIDTNRKGANFIGLFINRRVNFSKTRRTRFISLTESAISETPTTETTTHYPF